MELFNLFIQSQFYKRKSPNLTKLGFSFENDPKNEFLKIQSMLYSEYYINGESMLTLMRKFSIPSSKTMDIIFRIFDVRARSFSESTLNALNLNRAHPRVNAFTVIYHTSWTGEVVCLRSSYEEDYAKLLDAQRIRYAVEHLRIKYYSKQENRYRIAVPDFYLPDNTTIVEIKSLYWLNAEEMRNKRDAYLALGYKFKLILEHKEVEDW